MDILIVDDNEENLYFLSLLLKGHGHTVHQAVNGAEALEILSRQQVALIISDILMPVMDGFQLCRTIKADAKFADVPVIFYTATYTGSQDEELSLKVGASRFVVKPCEPEEMMRIVDDVLAESKLAARAAVPLIINEEEVLKLYSERLVRKLEQKMLELEAEVARAEFDDLSSCQIAELSPGAYAMIAVSDTGCGISSEHISRIFEPFFTTKGKAGTGLGLATSYGIVKQHGGSIWVYSEAGAGTTFKIYLPLNREADSVVETKAELTEACDATIMVIEDDKTVLKMIGEILARAGYRVIKSSEPVEALILAKGFIEPIHLIISDHKMPGMSGTQVCEKICQLHPEAQVMFMSGYPVAALTEGNSNVQKAVFLQKPVTVNSLLSKCSQALNPDKLAVPPAGTSQPSVPVNNCRH